MEHARQSCYVTVCVNVGVVYVCKLDTSTTTPGVPVSVSVDSTTVFLMPFCGFVRIFSWTHLISTHTLSISLGSSEEEGNTGESVVYRLATPPPHSSTTCDCDVRTFNTNK